MLAAAVSVLVLGFIAVAGASALASPAPEETTQGGDWLQVINTHRQSVGLRSVRNDPALSERATELAQRRLAGKTVDLGAVDVIDSADADASDRELIDRGLSSPFHLARLLAEDLEFVGYGSARNANGESIKAVAALDLSHRRSSTTTSLATPRVWPADGSVTSTLDYSGGSSPDPSDYCKFSGRTGPPILVWWPRSSKGTTATITVNGAPTPVDECVITTWGTAHSSDEHAAMVERTLAPNVAIIIPSHPFEPGDTVEVSVSAHRQDGHRWSFRTAGSGATIRFIAN